MNITTQQRYYCLVQDRVTGPFDLIELAGHLKCANITAQTSVCLEETQTWLPLGDLAEFAQLQEISIETIARHLEQKERSHPVSLSSSQPMEHHWGWLQIGLVLTGVALTSCILFWYHWDGLPDDAQRDWVPTVGYNFVVRAPVALRKKGTGIFSCVERQSRIATTYAEDRAGNPGARIFSCAQPWQPSANDLSYTQRFHSLSGTAGHVGD